MCLSHAPSWLAGLNEEIARLKSEVKAFGAESERLAEDNRACYNVIASKDKEIKAMQQKVWPS
jgi:hypothetical protein